MGREKKLTRPLRTWAVPVCTGLLLSAFAGVTQALEVSLPAYPPPYGSSEYGAYYESYRKQDSTILAYREIAEAFNRRLAGKYPFGERDAPDVSRRDVCEFYRRHGERIKTLQSEVAALKDSKDEVRFLGRLETAGEFLAETACSRFNQPIRIAPRPEETKPVTSAPERVWVLTDDFGRARFPHGAPTLDWRFGSPLALKVTWGSQTGLRPRAATTNDGFETPDSATIEFRSKGEWALMRFVDSHRPSHIWRRKDDSSAETLEFRVPLVPILKPSVPRTDGPSAAYRPPPRPEESWVTLVMRLRFEHYGAGKPRHRLTWPAPFPVVAP